ncbi:MAG: hypothetical protein IPF84_16710 [Proteobacteria bacterium]|nr:hypothetical protein [Pseudomonadota bacterium]
MPRASRSGVRWLATALPAGLARHSQRHDQHRYDGRRYVVVDRLPRGCRHVYYRGQPYYYHGAHWYRPYGARFVAVAPPAGVIIDGRGVTFYGVGAAGPLVRPVGR